MTVKTNGAEFVKYYSDSEYWGDDWWEDGRILINGVETETPEKCQPTDVISIIGGYMLDGSGRHVDISLETHFKRWQKAQTTTAFVVEVPKVREKELKDLVRRYAHRHGIKVKIK